MAIEANTTPRVPSSNSADTDRLMQLVADYFAASNDYAVRLGRAHADRLAQFGDGPFDGQSEANRAFRAACQRHGVDEASPKVDRLVTAVERVIAKTRKYPVASVADLRPLVLAMLYECAPTSIEGSALEFSPDDGGASEALFRSAAKACGLADFVASIEAGLASRDRKGGAA